MTIGNQKGYLCERCNAFVPERPFVNLENLCDDCRLERVMEKIEKNTLNLSKKETIEILHHIQKRLSQKREVLNGLDYRTDQLKKELTKDLVEEGNCPHTTLITISDMADLNEGKIRFKCKDCNSILIQKKESVKNEKESNY